MQSSERIIGNSIHVLRQAVELLGRLTDDQYATAGPGRYASSVGAHIRHILDHYFRFLDGLSGGRIDYDSRTRDPRIEDDRAFAIAQFNGTIVRLQSFVGVDARHALETRVEVGDVAAGDVEWVASTVGREIDFLLSHAIHHYGMIAIMLRMEGFDPGSEFGVAPSTLRYVQGRVLCAP